MTSRERFLAVSALAVAGLVSAAPAAVAVPADNPNASCVGSGSSSLAPGQDFPFSEPGARADVAHFGKDLAGALGTSPGQLVKMSAHQKGTAIVCFPGGPPGG